MLWTARYGDREPVMMPPMPRSPEYDVSAEIMRRAEQLMRDDQVQALLQQLQWRLQEEARHRRWHRIVAKYKARAGEFDPGDVVLTR
jgi:hypothetical protein